MSGGATSGNPNLADGVARGFGRRRWKGTAARFGVASVIGMGVTGGSRALDPSAEMSAMLVAAIGGAAVELLLPITTIKNDLANWISLLGSAGLMFLGFGIGAIIVWQVDSWVW